MNGAIDSHRRYRPDLDHTPAHDNHWPRITAILLLVAALIEASWLALGIVVSHNPHLASRLWLLGFRPAIVTGIVTIAETVVAYLITREYPTPTADKVAYLLLVAAFAAAAALAFV